MSLDIDLLVTKPVEVHSSNITHNLVPMAKKLGVYKALWYPEESGYERAEQLIAPITEALRELRLNPAYYSEWDAPNGWGKVKDFVSFLEDMLGACEYYPEAKIQAER